MRWIFVPLFLAALTLTTAPCGATGSDADAESTNLSNLANDAEIKIARNFRDGREELELVRELLSQHKARLGRQFDAIANAQPDTPHAEGAGERAAAQHTEQEAAAARAEEADDDEALTEPQVDAVELHEQSPEILQLNKHFRDYLYQGDMALTAAQARQIFFSSFEEDEETADNNEVDAVRSVLRARRQAINVDHYPDYKWPHNISYSFRQDVDPETKEIIQNALNFWESNTCLSFNEWSGGDDNERASSTVNGVLATTNGTSLESDEKEETDENIVPQLEFFKGDGCWSYVGKSKSAVQPISIGEGCEHFGVASHEIAHALGFFHAQSRYDRDKYVTFKLRNVEAGFEDQFGKERPTENNNYGVIYDYGSVLHYSDSAFAKTADKPVLVAHEPHNQNTMGQRVAPSFSDVLVMNKHYGCLGQCKNPHKCKYDGYPNPKNCSACICPWGFGGADCSERQTTSGGDAPAGDCGRTVQASTKWQDLNATVGSMEKVLRNMHSGCHFHVQAPTGRHVQVRVMSVGRVCSSGCFYGNTELKLGNFGRTGHRMCCPSDVRGRPVFRSKKNLAVLSVYSRYYLQSFRVRYRYV